MTTLLLQTIMKNVATMIGGEKMSAMKKGTKLSDNPKDYMLRVRMDVEILSKLDKICETENLSRSEAVRKGIEEQYHRINK